MRFFFASNVLIIGNGLGDRQPVGRRTVYLGAYACVCGGGDSLEGNCPFSQKFGGGGVSHVGGLGNFSVGLKAKRKTRN